MHCFHYSIPNELIQSQYQHLHHAEALKFLERGRLDLLEKIGFPNPSLMNRGVFLVITDISVRYKRELFAGSITVECQRTFLEGRDLVIEQRILNEKGKVAIEATVKSCCMCGTLRRAMAIPDDLLAAFLAANSADHG
jgi:YbgC/YbaW family acyl-CoA thioester hydrolase